MSKATILKIGYYNTVYSTNGRSSERKGLAYELMREFLSEQSGVTVVFENLKFLYKRRKAVIQAERDANYNEADQYLPSNLAVETRRVARHHTALSGSLKTVIETLKESIDKINAAIEELGEVTPETEKPIKQLKEKLAELEAELKKHQSLLKVIESTPYINPEGGLAALCVKWPKTVHLTATSENLSKINQLRLKAPNQFAAVGDIITCRVRIRGSGTAILNSVSNSSARTIVLNTDALYRFWNISIPTESEEKESE